MAEKKRGRLKIFLGYVAGVGKTFSMLDQAQILKREGKDIVIGYILTHGRVETERLRQGLEEIPPVQIDYKGARFEELDTKAVLQRMPEIVLIDELAHTNLPGMWHPKRYKDIEDILDAGIDVFSTLNIQHVESLHDAVQQATGIEIKERVPDRIVDKAEEIEIVDLPIEELQDRLREGKVYVPKQAARAIENFFKKETLLLLREMTLRKVAAIVDVSRSVSSHALGTSKSPLAPKLLASVGPSPFSEKVVRSCKRLSDLMKAEWHVVSVETVESKLIPIKAQEQLSRNLELAHELGATVAVLPGESIAKAVLEYAKRQSVTHIVIGHSLRPWWRTLFQKSPVDELIRSDTMHDIYIISSSHNEIEKKADSLKKDEIRSSLFPIWKTFVLPLVLVALIALCIMPFAFSWPPEFIGFMFLLATPICALFVEPMGFFVFLGVIFLLAASTEWLGFPWVQRDPSIYSFSLIFVGFIINQLTQTIKKALSLSLGQKEEVLSLLDLSRDLVSASTVEQMLVRLNARLRLFMEAEALLYIKDGDLVRKVGKIEGVPFSYIEETAARWTLQHNEKSGCKTATLPSAFGVWYPLTIGDKTIGALGVYAKKPADLEMRSTLIESFVHLMALSLDRG
jgi:two-component system sensor histidine kinase KdpD